MMKCDTPSSPNTWGKSSQKTMCDCCPYGYHIDLDFVRYCEAFNQTPRLSPESKLRERRRQRQSMEVLLGLTNPIEWQLEQEFPAMPVGNKRPALKYSEPIPSSVTVCRDGLHKAVLDFEATLLSSNRRPSNHEVSDEHMKSILENSSLDIEHGLPLRRTTSTPSVASSESMNATSSFAMQLNPADLVMDSDLASICSAASGVSLSTAALTAIREQMAKSLEKIREMEESQKIIPRLQSQIATLEESKRKLSDLLKSQREDQNKVLGTLVDLYLEANQSETSHEGGIKKDLEPIEVAVQRRMAEMEITAPKVEEDDDVFHSHLIDKLVDLCKPGGKRVAPPKLRTYKKGTEKTTRDVGVECSVLTRDIGVSHASRKWRTVDTQTAQHEFSISSVPDVKKEENVAPTSVAPQQEGREKHAAVTNVKDAGVQAFVVSKNASTITKPDSVSVFCTTDLKMGDVFTKSEGTVWKQQILQEYKDQQTLRAQRCVDKAVTAKPRCSTVAVNAVPRVRDMGSSDCTINSIVCDKCSVRKKSIGVDTTNLFGTRGAGTPTSHIAAMTRSKSSDYFKLTPRFFRTTAVKSTDTKDLTSFRDASMSTQKAKVVDVAVGDRVSSRDASVETEPMQESVSKAPVVASNGASRIPRLSKSPSAAREKKPFHRQDTYTKIVPECPAVPVVSVEDEPVTPADVNMLMTAEHNNEDQQFKHRFTAMHDPSDEDLDRDEEETALYSNAGCSLFGSENKKMRQKAEPSKEMRGAMKVLSDSLKKSPRSEVPPQLKNATTIIQQEWFKISSTGTANPLDVEDYLDIFEEISSQLLQHIVNMPDNSGNTAMHYAVSHGNFDVVSILLDSKVCNINQPNLAGYTSVMLVSLAQMRSETDSQVVQRLFQLADVNVRAKQHGQTALMLAASHGRLKMATMLLAAGADVNIQDDDGSTALMCAAEHGHVEMVRLLLTQPDCDVSVADHDGSTALNIAMEAGHRDVGVLLYAHQHFSRGNSPYASLKPTRKSKS